MSSICSHLEVGGEQPRSAGIMDRLAAGSGVVFRHRREHELKGVPETRRLHAVTG
jgi:hypothetical protein